MLGFGYSIAIELTISTTSLACYVYDTVKMHMNDVKELKQEVVEDLQIYANAKESKKKVVEDLQINDNATTNLLKKAKQYGK